MREFAYGLCGTLIGGGAGFALSLLDAFSEIAVWVIAACSFTCIGAMLGTLGGLLTARLLGKQDRQLPK